MDSPKFPSIQSTSELIDHAIEKGGDLMARSIAMAYESKSRLGEHPSDPTDPFRRINRLMDTADSRNRVVEQCGAIRDEIEATARCLVPCVERSSLLPADLRKLMDIWVELLTEVMIDATGD